MTIFNKVALQGLKGSKTRTLVTIIGVILSTALITGIATFAVSLQSYMINGAVAKYGGWHIGFTDVPAAFAKEQADDKRVEKVSSFENIGYAVLEGGTNAYKPYVFIAGFHEETFDTLPVELLSGRLPENSGEILVPAHVAANGGVKYSVGDVVTFDVGGRVSEGETLNQHDPYRTGESGTETLVPAGKKTYTVAGLYQRPAFEEHSAPGYTCITLAEQNMEAGSATAVISLKNPYQLHAYIESVQGGSYMLNDNVLRFMGLSNDNLFNVMLYSAGAVLVILIMIGSVFMIYNAFHISLNERTHQFGLLMSVGATERQLRNSVLFEGVCIGAVGIPAGMLIGLPSVQLILMIVEKCFTNVLYSGVSLKLAVSLPVLAAAAAVSLITILISAYIPAKKASRMPVMECIRQTGEIKVEAKKIKISGPAKRLYGLEGLLALKNFKRSKRRYRSIVLSLTFSVVLFVSASAFGLYMKQLAVSTIVDTDCDIAFSMENMEKEEFFMFYDNLSQVDGIYENAWQEKEGAPGTLEMTFRSHNPGRSVAQMKEILEGAGITSGYSLENYHELLEQNRNLLFVIRLFTVVFAGMVALIGVANVFNTISTNIRLRRRELAMLRSIGMSDRDFDKMMRFECVFYGMRTLMFSLPLSAFFSWLVYLGIMGGMRSEEAENVAFTLPWGSIGISLCAVFFVIFITMLYTASQIKKENIIDAVRDDMA